jgi:hypothetical protein
MQVRSIIVGLRRSWPCEWHQSIANPDLARWCWPAAQSNEQGVIDAALNWTRLVQFDAHAESASVNDDRVGLDRFLAWRAQRFIFDEQRTSVVSAPFFAALPFFFARNGSIS